MDRLITPFLHRYRRQVKKKFFHSIHGLFLKVLCELPGIVAAVIMDPCRVDRYGGSGCLEPHGGVASPQRSPPFYPVSHQHFPVISSSLEMCVGPRRRTICLHILQKPFHLPAPSLLEPRPDSPLISTGAPSPQAAPPMTNPRNLKLELNFKELQFGGSDPALTE